MTLNKKTGFALRITLISFPIVLYIIAILCTYFYNKEEHGISEYQLYTDTGKKIFVQTYKSNDIDKEYDDKLIYVFLCSSKKHILTTWEREIKNPNEEIYFEHYGMFKNVDAYYFKFENGAGLQNNYYHLIWIDEEHEKFCGGFTRPSHRLRVPRKNSESIQHYEGIKDFYLNRIEYELDYNYKLITETDSLRSFPTSPVFQYFLFFDEPLGKRLLDENNNIDTLRDRKRENSGKL